ncbi:4 [Durusdinium trenchii]|uniref:4 n=1 Tax=Durusdinium trenchii TaxID=1381693 RepID=A0ABP0RS89_9DINO
MLHETEFFSHVDYTLKMNMYDFPPSSEVLVKTVISQMCHCAVKAVANNSKNQMQAYRSVDAMRTLVAEQPECALLLAEIFKGNFEICRRVPEDLIDQFSELILRERSSGSFVSCYIDFYMAIVSAGNKPVVRNQVPVVEALQRGRPERMLYLLRSSSELEHALDLARHFKSKSVLRGEDTSELNENDQELVYYLKSLELLGGIARGRGSHSLITKPFVSGHSGLIHPTSAIRNLLRTSTTRERRPRDLPLSPIAVAHLTMASQWLELVRHLTYDVDVNLRDIILLSSPLHVEFVRALLDWTRASLEAPPRLGGPEVEEVVYFRNLLLCIDAFFSFCYTPVCESDATEGMLGLATDYYAYFGRVMQMQASVMYKKSSNAKRWSIAEEEADLLNIAGTRVLQITSGEDASKEIHAMSTHVEVEQKATSETEAQWRAMLQAFRRNPQISEGESSFSLGSDLRHGLDAGITGEDERVGNIIIEIGALTDPDRDEYTRFLPPDLGSTLPDGELVDNEQAQAQAIAEIGWIFGGLLAKLYRNLITCEDVLKQIMQHQVYLRSDLDSLRRVQRLLLGMLASARKSMDPLGSVQMVHRAIVASGITKLIVEMLDDLIFTSAPEDVTDSAWQLLIEVLCEVRTPSGGQSVSKPMQQSILEVCMTGSDAGMFESFRELTSTVISKAKATRSLSRGQVPTRQEQRQIDEYKAWMADAVRAMEAMRLMVEGHFFPMQQHLHSQSGSSRSCDVLEQTCRLVVQMAKDPKGGDSMMPEEIQCISQALTLLIELCQGPNLQNQEVVSTLGLVETSSRLLQPNFELICQLEGDVYPPTVRRLKALLMDGMLALVEGRLDSQIHVTIPQRLDPLALKECGTRQERIEFVHSYFVFGIVGVARRTVQSDQVARIPLEANTRHLLSSSGASPSDVYQSLLAASVLAEELLEDLSDADIRNFFSEGLKMVQLILEVAQYSSTFESIVKPTKDEDETFVDDTSQYLSEKHYLQERQKFHMRSRYRLAYGFLSRFVRTIEVMMDGNLHYLHFCLPVTAMWYVYGEAKQNILDTVPFASPDIKARYFIKKCITLHRESKLIKDLSRFSVVPEKLLKLAQRSIPDWMHRPFQIFLCDDAKNMSRLLRSALFLGLALSAHTGMFLVPGDEEDKLHGLHAKWSSPRAEFVAHSLSCLYFTCTALWLLLTIAIKLPIVMYEVEEVMLQGHQRFAIPRVVLGAYASSRLLRDGQVAWRILLLLCCFCAFTFRHYWLNAFILMDFWCQSAVLATVFRAIASPLKSLAMTFLGLLIITFVYAAIGFRFFREDFHNFCDESILICTENILYQGTRGGIVGLSPMMSSTRPGQSDWTQRMIYDMSYFIIFGVIVLNTVVGLIVDSFGALRLDMEARENDQQTQTFISCIDRRDVEQVAQSHGIADGFEFHETYRQNKWDYMAFIFHLCEAQLEDLTGPEHYIRQLMDKGDAKWFPIGQSKFLEGTSMGMNQQDRFMRIQEQTNYLASFVEANQDSWKSISRSMSQLSSAIRDKLDGMLTELRDLQLELKQQRMLKELQAEQGTTL